MLAELTGHKPGLKVLNKQDLADPERTEQWLAHYNALPDTRAIGLDASQTTPARQLVEACHALAPNRGGMAKPMRVLICGIPNVGKSTLINTLAGGRKAKTGDEAGITKLEQRITLADDFYLWDTPGMLWPRIIVAKSGYNLAASGAVGRNAFDEEEVALELLDYVKRHYAAPGRRALQARPRCGNGRDPAATKNCSKPIGRKRGALLGKGRVNLQKAAEIVMHAFRERQPRSHHARDAGGVRGPGWRRASSSTPNDAPRRKRGVARASVHPRGRGHVARVRALRTIFPASTYSSY